MTSPANNDAPRPAELASSLGRPAADMDVAALPRVLLRLGRQLRLAAGDRTLSPTQLAVLVALEDDGPQSPGQLASRERMRGSTLTKVLATLQGLELVSRTVSTADRRRVTVTITPHGRESLRVHSAVADAWLVRRFSDLDDDSRRLLTEVIPIFLSLSE